MESNQESSIIDTDDQMSTTDSENPSNVTSSTSLNDDTMWDRIQRVTWSANQEFWSKLLNEDKMLFRIRFKEYFIEACKTQLYVFHDFIENDETWNSLMETKSQIYEDISEDDEAFFSAVDKRKYKLLKTINWEQVEAELLDEDSSDGSDAENDQDENEQLID